MQNNQITEQIYRYIFDSISLPELESWLYIELTNSTNGVVNPFLKELISFNFIQKDAEIILKNVLKRVWEITYFEDITYERIRRILRDIINETIPINEGCHELSGLYFSGYDFIPYDFDSFYSEMLDIPLPIEYLIWNKNALEEKLEKLENYKEQVISLSKSFLMELEKHI
ncbi:hypothetical protein [Paenibacillus sp. sgz500958]|uniref:hypothetical protein n=1 Tax=Paenibacillus sp. sgz500958 TaxID=3242475 RepID=UPI0036D21484